MRHQAVRHSGEWFVDEMASSNDTEVPPSVAPQAGYVGTYYHWWSAYSGTSTSFGRHNQMPIDTIEQLGLMIQGATVSV